MYCPAESVDWCQCCQQGVALTAGSGAADFFGDNNPPKVIDSANNAGCFHILSPFLVGTPVPGCPRTPQERCPYDCFTNYDAIICKREKIILLGFTIYLV